MRPFLRGMLMTRSCFVIYAHSLFSAQWGFHPGGWGKPPLDEYNRPLYGDVFGVLPKADGGDVSLFLTWFMFQANID
jgi:hypothetical protein